MKTLKQILEVYSPKSADEKRFVKKHITVKTPDPAGNNDDVYQATNIKTIDRAKERKGYDAKASEAVYEAADQIDELKKSTLASYASKASKSAAGLATTAMHHKNTSDQHDKLGNKKQSNQFHKYSFDATEKQIKRQKGVDSALKRLAKEEFEGINDPLIEEMLNEVLAKDAKAADYISDFVKSDNPKFAGKSKAKRIQMALGAYYSKQKGE
jgi:hypothetical protein